MKEDQTIDKIFSQRLGDAVDETAYREDDWKALEQLLDKGKKRRALVYWIPVLSGVAAILLIMLGWWLFKPQATHNNQMPQKLIVKAGQPNKPPINNSSNEGVAKNNATQPFI